MRAILAMLLVTLLAHEAQAQRLAPFDASRAPFVEELGNIAPLVFGMRAADAAIALGVPLTYLRGRPGHEMFLAVRPDGGTGFFPRRDQLYLQFRNDRLTGVKGDWGRDWLWQ